MSQPFKRLYRSRSESQIAGVCGGMGLYFGLDPVLIRLILVVITLATGVFPGVLTYVAAWIITPLEPLPMPATRPAAQPQQSQG
jgi:phage shock protein C